MDFRLNVKKVVVWGASSLARIYFYLVPVVSLYSIALVSYPVFFLQKAD